MLNYLDILSSHLANRKELLKIRLYIGTSLDGRAFDGISTASSVYVAAPAAQSRAGTPFRACFKIAYSYFLHRFEPGLDD